MAEPCTVLIGAAELQTALRDRAGVSGEVLFFSDTEALRALEAITRRHPHVVVLERLFAATPRGAALIGRIKADPALSAEIRIVAHDSDYVRVSARAAATAAPAPPDPVAPVSVATTPPKLDYRGTRRAPRFRIAEGVEVLLDGNPATLADLSVIGAQVVSPTILRPNQRVRMTLPDDVAVLRFNGGIAWASFELVRPSRTPHYRAGVEFSDADPQAVGAFCERHKKT